MEGDAQEGITIGDDGARRDFLVGGVWSTPGAGRFGVDEVDR